MINTILIFDLHMTNNSLNNNFRSEGFGIQRSKDNLSRVSVELAEIFAQLSGVFV
jgi:hypothetical protein